MVVFKGIYRYMKFCKTCDSLQNRKIEQNNFSIGKTAVTLTLFYTHSLGIVVWYEMVPQPTGFSVGFLNR
jgi:hypothetical protein